MEDKTIDQWHHEFQVITGSEETADRLISLITAYTKRSTWKWEQLAEATKRDLLKGQSVEAVIQWFANIVVTPIMRAPAPCGR